MRIPNPYLWKDYKLLALIPLALLLFAAFFIPKIPQGIDLRGGLLATIYTESAPDVAAVKSAVARFSPNAAVRAFSNPTGQGVEVELPVDEGFARAEESVKRLHELDAELVKAEVNASFVEQEAGKGNATQADLALAKSKVSALEQQIFFEANTVFKNIGVDDVAGGDAHDAVRRADEAFSGAKADYRERLIKAVSGVVSVKSSSVKEIGSSLSKFFFGKTREIIVLSFALSALIIFLVFRSLVPSLAVVFGAFADIAITAGFMGFFGIPLSLASFAALLMLIGFSLDTDVLLTIRVIKRHEGTAAERAFDAMKTAVVMNATTIAAFGVLTILALWLQVATYYQIGAVAVVGGFVDFIATWGANAVMILWYVEGKEKRGAQGA